MSDTSKKQPYYLAVVGGRDFDNIELLTSTLDSYIDTLVGDYDVTIVSGGAKGADELAKKYALNKGLSFKVFIPNWDNGTKAGPIRNKKIVQASHEVIAFWDEISKGTKSTIDIARKLNVECTIIYY